MSLIPFALMDKTPNYLIDGLLTIQAGFPDMGGASNNYTGPFADHHSHKYFQ